MFKYGAYLLLLTSKKLSTYLIPLIFGITFGGLIMLEVNANKHGFSTVLTLNPYYYFFPFIFGPLYMTAKAINIFKDGENNGTELLIVSRPIGRTKIVLAKFGVLYLHIMFFTLFTAAFMGGISLLDKYSSGIQRWQFVSSLVIGVLVINILMSAVITLVSTILSKVGTLVFACIVPFIFMISSVIIAPMSHANVGGTFTRMHVVNSKNVDKYLDGEYMEPSKTFSEYSIGSKYKRQKEGWYKNVKYFDVYTQLSSFYKLNQPDFLSGASIKSIKQEQKKITSDILFGEKHKYVFAPNIHESSPNSINGIKWMLKHVKEIGVKMHEVLLRDVVNFKQNHKTGRVQDMEMYKWLISTNVEKFNKHIPEILMKEYIEPKYKNDPKELAKVKSILYTGTDKYVPWTLLGLTMMTTPTFYSNPNFKDIQVIDPTKTAAENKSRVAYFHSYGVFRNNEIVNVYKAEHWLPLRYVNAMWISLAIILAILTIIRYLKRDFK